MCNSWLQTVQDLWFRYFLFFSTTQGHKERKQMDVNQLIFPVLIFFSKKNSYELI
jgi:hypothetical protein